MKLKSIDCIVMVSLDSVQSENYHKNIRHGGDNPCIICGKEITGKHKEIQLLTSGHIVSTIEPIENSQGFFPVGLCCAKKLHINFAF